MSDAMAEILAKCLERMEAGASLESCLSDFPEQAAELEPLLRMTLQMQPFAKVGPRPAFAQSARLDLENQLVTSGKDVTFKQLNRHTRQEPSLLPKRRFSMNMLRFIVAAILSLTATTAGVAYAANASNPGDPLYGLDIAMENIQVNLAPDVSSKVQLRLEFANERLDEAQAKFSENDVTNGLDAMNGYGTEISAAAQLVGGADGANRDALNSLLEAAQGVHKEVLTKLLDTVPNQAKDSIQKAIDAANAPGGLPEAANGNHGNPNATATPEATVAPESTEPPATEPAVNGVGVDVSTCAKSLSQDDAQALADLAKQNGMDYQYVLENFCVLGTLDKVREMLAGLPHVPTNVPAGPPSEVPSGRPTSVPNGSSSNTHEPPTNVPGGSPTNHPGKP